MDSSLEGETASALILGDNDPHGDGSDTTAALNTHDQFTLNTVIGDAGFTTVDLSGQVLAASADTSGIILTNGATEATSADSVDMVSGHFVADASTLRSLIASGAVQLTDANGQPIDISVTSDAQVFQLLGQATASAPLDDRPSTSAVKQERPSNVTSNIIQEPPPNITLPPLPTNVPPGTPAWAARLRDFEKIGDYYRGWVENDIELDLLLTFHKQQTQSTWGTRQSPCTSKQTTRLMWKSQYAPFDGIPFLNAGSRAIVMECQFGPRRKGAQARKEVGPLHHNFKKTCPARIYVKKVKKFIEFAVEIVNDKKVMKAEMDRSFQLLKEREFNAYVQERYYVQLPTAKAHENHAATDGMEAQQQQVERKPSVSARIVQVEAPLCSRLHPLVQEKIRNLVAGGETRLYAIRKQLRKYVEKDLFEQAENVPDRHNLTYFPTVHDLQNHIHQGLLDIENGTLKTNYNHVTLDIIPEEQSGLLSGDLKGATWSPAFSEKPHAQTVTVTLTHAPTDGEEGHMVSKVETQLSDGTTRVSDSLNAETARLLAKLHPNMFPLNSLLQHVPLQEGQQTSVCLNVPHESAESQLLADAATSSENTGLDLSNPRHTDSMDLAAACTLGQLPPNPEDDKQGGLGASGNGSLSDQQTARVIAASSDQTGYALVQTETGALLLAKCDPSNGYQILGQAGATFTANLDTSSLSIPSHTDGGESAISLAGAGILTDQSQVSTDSDTLQGIQSNHVIQYGTGLDAGDGSGMLNAQFAVSSIKTEVGSGDHY